MQVNKFERFGVVAIAFGLLMVASCTGADQSSDAAGSAAADNGKAVERVADSAEEAKSAAPAAAAKEVTTASGLKYQVLTAGSGASPGPTDRVTVHYRGTLTDGTEFDSSYKRGAPSTFPVNRVIAGWTEALQLMHVGDKWRLTIPPELAYGKRGAGRLIGPDATLIFEVELIKIN